MLEDKTLKQVKEIIFKFIDPKEYRVFIFGSRVIGNARKFSDIDIGIEGKKSLELKKKYDIEDEFEESDIPYFVDVVDFTKVSKKFYDEAKKFIQYLN